MPTQLVSCEGTRVPQGTKDEFWQGIDRADQTNFPPQHILTKAMVSRQRLTKWWVGLKMDLKKIWPDFLSVNTFPPKSQCDVLDLSVLNCALWHRSREWMWKGELCEGTGGATFVEQQLGWYRALALAERTSLFKLFLKHMLMWSWSKRGKVGVCVRCCVQHRAHNLLTRSVSARLLASRLTI